MHFLGMATYLIKFVPNFSEVTSPLQVPLKEDVAWHWTTEMTEAFSQHSPAHQHNSGDLHSRHLPPLSKSQSVWSWHGTKWAKAEVTQCGPQPRCYKVKTPSGMEFFRNKKHLQLRVGPPSFEVQSSAEDYYESNFQASSSGSLVHPSSLKDI